MEEARLGAILFLACLVSLIVSWLAFRQDLNLAPAALKLEQAPTEVKEEA